MIKTRWQKILAGITSGDAAPAQHVLALHLPQISGWEEGRVWAHIVPHKDLLQPQGAVFGGYLSAVADEMVGMATLSVLGDTDTFSTLDLRMQFLRPLIEGELNVEAHVINQSRSAVHVEASFTCGQGKLIAKASAVQIVKPLK